MQRIPVLLLALLLILPFSAADAQPGGKAEVDLGRLQKSTEWSGGVPASAGEAARRAAALTGVDWEASRTRRSGPEHRGHPVWRLEGDEAGRIHALRLWTCPQSGRTFAAEMYVDRSLETDLRWMDHLEAMAASTACHGPIRPAPVMLPPHTRAVREPGFGLGLRIPESWEWGRWGEGAGRDRGALWFMDAESVGTLMVRRQDDRTGTLEEFFLACLESLPVLLAGEDRTVKVVPGEVQNVEGSRYSEGYFSIRDSRWDWIDGSHRFVFQAFRARGEYHGLLLAWLSETEIRGHTVGLEPDWQRLREWLDRAKSGYRP